MAGDGEVAMAGGSTIAASVIATWHIYKHLCNYTEPMFQRYTVRIIFMIHVYGLMSFLALVRPGEAIYFNCICGIYEAWVIYNFLSLCIAFLGGPGVVATNLQGRYLKPSWHLMTCCCDAIPLDGVFIRQCKRGVLQFVIMKPLLVGATLMLYESGLYEDGSFSITSGYFYITIVYTFSYTVALGALVLFYVACKHMLEPFRPLPKFLIIKSIVFLTFWQGVLIALLANGGVIKTAQDALDVQNIAVCVEMLFAAIGYLHAFPYQVYAEANTNGQAGSIWHSILHALNFTDVVYDTMHQFAPTYHEYVLYSNGSQDAPQRYRVSTTVVPTSPSGQSDQEMEVVAVNMWAEPRAATSKSWSNEPVPQVTAADREEQERSALQAKARADAHVPMFGQFMARLTNAMEHGKPPHEGASRTDKFSSNDDFNPRALTPQGRLPAASHATNHRWGTAAESRRESASEDEVTEFTKLTDRRASDHGPLMDTIDLRGENEEYSEGFIQR